MSKAMYRDKVEGWRKKNLLVKKPEIKKEKIDFLNKAKHNLRVALVLLKRTLKKSIFLEKFIFS